jgi:Mce-associated membrane protein
VKPRLALAARLLVVLVIVAGVAGFLAMRGQTHRLTASEDAGQAATRTARATVPKMLSYTAGTLAGQLKTNRQLLTSDYAPRYEAMVRSRVLPTATKFGVANTLTVVSAAVVSATPTRAVVLVFANQTTRTQAQSKGVTQGTRLQVTMRRHGTKWLVDEVRPV